MRRQARTRLAFLVICLSRREGQYPFAATSKLQSLDVYQVGLGILRNVTPERVTRAEGSTVVTKEANLREVKRRDKNVIVHNIDAQN